MMASSNPREHCPSRPCPYELTEELAARRCILSPQSLVRQQLPSPCPNDQLVDEYIISRFSLFNGVSEGETSFATSLLHHCLALPAFRSVSAKSARKTFPLNGEHPSHITSGEDWAALSAILPAILYRSHQLLRRLHLPSRTRPATICLVGISAVILDQE